MLSSTIPIPKAPTMNNQHVPRAKTLTIFLLIFLFLANLNVITTSNDSIYTPTDLILVSCGSSGGMDQHGRKWTGDLKPSGFLLSEPPTNKSTASSATYQGSTDGIPYTNARLSRSTFTYSFALAPGKKFLRLYFNPDVYHFFSKSGDYIDVKAGNHLLLSNFSASVYSANWTIPSFSMEYFVNVGRGERLNVSFYPSNYEGSYVFINGIEIVSMPDDLYYSPNPPLIGRGKEYDNRIGNDTVMKVVSRLNVGGYQISKMDDTGMFRTWDSDEDYGIDPTWYGIIALNQNVTLNFTRVPRYIAPEDLYKSARSMGRNRVANEMTNMTWNLYVQSAFDHLVRLHFCEFARAVTKVNDRRFIIYIDNQTAEAGFDVLEASGGKNIPIYRDYVVRSAKGSGSTVRLLFIKLHPHPESVFADVILNGLEVFRLSDPDGNLATPINADIPAPPAPAPASPAADQPPQPANNKSINKATLYGLIGGGGLFCLLMMLLVCLILVCTLKKRNHEDRTDPKSLICSWFLKPSHSKPSREGSSSSLPKDLCRKFSLSEIISATNSFQEDRIIGRGGFGYVYRGEIQIDETCRKVVAIKRSDQESRTRNHQGAKEFRAEIEMLSQLRHANLVSLIGYCNDKAEMALVYEYVSNGTLDSHLYGRNKDLVPWRRRLEICIGASRGLHYLHEGAVNKVIHRDVKTTNILIDENWIAKVSDFGLSKMFLGDKPVTTVVKGTWGYVDPEYFRGQALTEKSDVYSFGVVLLEVLFARKAVDVTLEEDQRSLVGFALNCIKQGTIHEAVDPYLMGRITPECFNMFVDIAERCVRNQGMNRPSMRDVMETLEFALKLQDTADSEQIEKGKDDHNGSDGGGGSCVYPCVPFRAPPIYKLGEIGDDDDDEDDGSGSGSGSDFGPVDLHDHDVSTSKSGSIFSGTTSKSSV